jgi:hypothetical protein
MLGSARVLAIKGVVVGFPSQMTGRDPSAEVERARGKMRHPEGPQGAFRYDFMRQRTWLSTELSHLSHINHVFKPPRLRTASTPRPYIGIGNLRLHAWQRG